MRLLIQGVSQAPSWISVERLVSATLDEDGADDDAEVGRLTQIRRLDGGCNYRGLGTYAATYTPGKGDDIPIYIEVTT